MVAASSQKLIELDANFLIAALIPGLPESRQLRGWLETGEVVQISSIAWSEYLCGPIDPEIFPTARELVPVVEAFTVEDAELASRLFNDTGRRSRSHADCMIAAHAIRRDARLATLDLRDFRPFEPFNLRLA